MNPFIQSYEVIDSESIGFVDVDQTLIMWGKAKKGEKVIHVTCPYSGEQKTLRPNRGNIKVLKDRYARGSYIIVWSAGGNKWADAVIKALGLKPYVNKVMSKATFFIDDKQAHEILGERVYVPYGDDYG